MQLNLELPDEMAEGLAAASRARRSSLEALALEAIARSLAPAPTDGFVPLPPASWGARFIRRLFSSGPRTMVFAGLLFAWANLDPAGASQAVRIPACLLAGGLLYTGVMELFDPLPTRAPRWGR